MRKADYSHLAKLLHDELKAAERQLKSPDAYTVTIATASRNVTIRIARSFANFAHVDKTAFLLACGIE